VTPSDGCAGEEQFRGGWRSDRGAHGENTKDVIDRVKEKIREIEPGLPAGVHIVSFYDRSELIEATVGTLRHALIEEIILVTLAHVIFLMHFRSILVVTLPLPLACSVRFC